MPRTRQTHEGLAARRLQSTVSSWLLLLLWAGPSSAYADDTKDAGKSEAGSPAATGLPADTIHDPRDDDSELTVQKGNIVAVPIPLSNPTFGTGLILGAAYFYAQSPEQQESQPASYTGLAGTYTTTDSWALGIGQQSYWGGDKWRFAGGAGYMDFQLQLRDPETGGSGGDVDWDIKGGLIQGNISRHIGGRWYGGVLARYLDIDQALDADSIPSGANTDAEIRSAGAGLTLEYDTRDLPTNAYTGRRLEGKAIYSATDGDRSGSYESYYLRVRSYHSLKKLPVVVAWDLNGCAKDGTIPLWDTCRINLRGFSLTDYLGDRSISAQIEARWHASSHWGFVAFAGAGYIEQSFSTMGDNERVPSYGAGVRYMVLQAKRINLRVDYARSDDSDAWYIAVGEAF